MSIIFLYLLFPSRLVGRNPSTPLGSKTAYVHCIKGAPFGHCLSDLLPLNCFNNFCTMASSAPIMPCLRFLIQSSISSICFKTCFYSRDSPLQDESSHLKLNRACSFFKLKEVAQFRFRDFEQLLDVAA